MLQHFFSLIARLLMFRSVLFFAWQKDFN